MHQTVCVIFEDPGVQDLLVKLYQKGKVIYLLVLWSILLPPSLPLMLLLRTCLLFLFIWFSIWFLFSIFFRVEWGTGYGVSCCNIWWLFYRCQDVSCLCSNTGKTLFIVFQCIIIFSLWPWIHCFLGCAFLNLRYIEERSFRRFVEACLEETVVVYVDSLLTQV